jgi:hypothetical protein
MNAVVLLSKTFFSQHPKAGKPTYFKQKVLARQMTIKRPDRNIRLTAPDGSEIKERKIHTCRTNYEYWKEKIDRLKAEGGVLSVRQWHEKPYRSPQEIIVDIPSEVVGVQKLTIEYGRQKFIPFVDNRIIHLPELAASDGLDTYDFIDWFKPVFEKEEKEILDFAIIHFTKFRY